MAEVTEKITAASRRPHCPTPPGAPGLRAQETRQALARTSRGYLTQPGVSPYDKLTWERRTASIIDSKGNVIFEQKDVEVPKDWSMTATNIVASKYLHGQLGTPQRETGVRQLVSRVAETIRDWGFEGRILPQRGRCGHLPRRAGPPAAEPVRGVQFAGMVQRRLRPQRAELRCAELALEPGVQERIEFSVTGYRYPQCSACFINSVQDTLDSILTLAKTEGMLFKWGSGTGTNLSPLRGSMEILSGGGQASGPLSFMKGFDAFAGVIKSGGKTRRAAKMVILNIDHPDIVEFIECKQKEEAKAFALAAGLRRQRTGFGSL